MEFSGIISGKSVRAMGFLASVREDTNKSSTSLEHYCISRMFTSKARDSSTWHKIANAMFFRKNTTSKYKIPQKEFFLGKTNITSSC